MIGTTGGMINMDSIEKIGHSIIQHGKFNNRIYLMKYDKPDHSDIICRLNDIADKNGYTKIIAKIPASVQPLFLMDGYTQEAYIPEFYFGNEGAFFMTKYFDPKRSIIPDDSVAKLLKLLSTAQKVNGEVLPGQFSMGTTKLRHIESMAKLYQQVFKTYPFPITEPAYLEKTMEEGNVIYFGIWDKGKLVGLSSAEIDATNLNAEMTDFAVLPEYRGQKLASFLLKEMENTMKKLKYKTLYTISRLDSPGITKTFINGGYHFTGILKNNTNISGQIESMNVFYKSI
jgi:beta-lysine N6-acetyltransferase